MQASLYTQKAGKIPNTWIHGLLTKNSAAGIKITILATLKRAIPSPLFFATALMSNTNMGTWIALNKYMIAIMYQVSLNNPLKTSNPTLITNHNTTIKTIRVSKKPTLKPVKLLRQKITVCHFHWAIKKRSEIPETQQSSLRIASFECILTIVWVWIKFRNSLFCSRCSSSKAQVSNPLFWYSTCNKGLPNFIFRLMGAP